ncbi:MAG: AmmeMemoRadiSam system radical SAM enzyme [Alphaproteobacteria bacterium]
MRMKTSTQDNPTLVTSKYWEDIGDGVVRCTICPRLCQFKKEGQRGFCFVRKRHKGKVALSAYGKSGGFCIDPIEKKPLNHFLPGTSVLSFGTVGCNLGCKFCQNWTASKSRKDEQLSADSTPEGIVAAAKHYGCRSVAFTYNDPVTSMEYAIAVSKACHAADIKTVAVTAGYMMPAPRAEFYQHIDAANIDLKAFTEEFYWKKTKSHLKTILETLQYVKHETNTWLEITNLVIPGQNDSPSEIDAMTRWIYKNLGDDVPIHFSAFHPDYKMMDIPRTPHATLAQARHIALNNGLKHVFIGNLRDPARQSTYCATCGDMLIRRKGYILENWHLNADGKCTTCGTNCAGVFEKKHGNWGSRRKAVDINQFTKK